MTTTNAINRWDYTNMNWEAYTGHRPPYLASLYKLIYEFHDKGGSGWERAADIGCGGGVITIELLKKFEKVFGCDASDEYLTQAAEMLKANIPDFVNRVTLINAKAEDLSAIPDSSVDMITMGMMIHWVDHPKSIAENARILKSHGTMMVIMYGMEAFFPGLPEAQTALDAVFDHWWSFSKNIFMDTAVAECQTFLAELQSLYFDPKVWKDVHRYRWFSEVPFGPTEDLGRAESRVGESDVIIQDLEDGKMQRDVDAEWLKVYYDHFIPDPRIVEHMKSAPWSELSDALNGGKATIAWPASMILAKKR